MTQWNAGDYAKQSSLQEAMAAEQLSLISLNGSEDVLDIGCGDGKITAKMADRLPKGSILGVDPSSQMVDFGQKNHAAGRNGRLSFQVGDARDLGFEKRFDLAVSFNALHWVREKDQPRSVASIHRALKPGGKTLLRFVAEGERQSLEDVIQEVMAGARWKGYFPAGYEKPYCHPLPATYEGWAAAAGFKVERVTLEDKTWDFGSAAGFEAFCGATFVEWNRFIPEGGRTAFIHDVLGRYGKVTGSNQHFKFYQLNAVFLRAE